MKWWMKSLMMWMGLNCCWKTERKMMRCQGKRRKPPHMCMQRRRSSYKCYSLNQQWYILRSFL